MSRLQAFWFHYNKPASKKLKHPVLTLHYAGACHSVRKIVCNVPVSTRERKHQPHVVMAGRGNISITGQLATINKD
jgi:hypothetical protein